VAKGEAMIHTKKDLLMQMDHLENNVAWKWQIERLEQKISVLQNVLVKAGVLVDATGVHQTIIIVDGEQYSIRKVK
jgi:hypothetical protein